jgi:AcrR family transcriptional regulator
MLATPENQRKSRLIDARRTLVLDAAQQVFLERGLEGASIREVAKRAGYTPGAIYSYFSSKEAIYAALLSASLERLKAAVLSAKPDKKERLELGAAAVFWVKSMAWFQFYSESPKELDLGFYLYRGEHTNLVGGVSTSLDAQLLIALAPAQEALVAAGLSIESALQENAATFAHGIGLLFLQKTARLSAFRTDPETAFKIQLKHTSQRLLSLIASEMGDQAGLNFDAHSDCLNAKDEEFMARQKALFD